MKAMAIDRFGGPEQLRMVELPEPHPAAGEVKIQVVCASVNPVDWKIREGLLQSRFPHHFPLVLGWDAAGIIVAMGEGAAGFALGERVYAYCRKPEVQWGTYAEYVTMPVDAVAPMPKTLDFVQAAAIPLVALTSWQALFDTAGLTAENSLLIHAGAGGIGSVAIQLAKHAGAAVIVTAGAANHDYVRQLGADYVVDYTQEDFVEAVRARFPSGVDVAYANVGGDILRRSYRALRQGGVLVSIVDQPIEDEAAAAGVRHAYVFVKPDGAQLRKIAALIDDGRIRPPAITEMPLDHAPRAQELSRQGHVRGKIVLRIAPD